MEEVILLINLKLLHFPFAFLKILFKLLLLRTTRKLFIIVCTYYLIKQKTLPYVFFQENRKGSEKNERSRSKGKLSINKIDFKVELRRKHNRRSIWWDCKLYLCFLSRWPWAADESIVARSWDRSHLRWISWVQRRYQWW